MAMTPEELRLKRCEWSRNWRAKNYDLYISRAREAARKKRAEDPEPEREHVRRYRAKNAEKIDAQRRARRDNDPEFRAADNAKRLAHHYAHREQANAKRIMNGQAARIASPWAKFFQSVQQRAKKKGVPFDLTREWVRARWTGRCEITGIGFRTDKATRGPGFFSPSIDRIIPEHGYVQGNCRFVLWAVNAFKSGGTDEDMILVARAIVAFSEENSAA